MSRVVIRPEEPADTAAVYEIVERAFGSPLEARLVDELRETADPRVSLVATCDDRVVGHVFFSPVRVGADDPSDPPAMGLGPVGVLPDRQGEAIGSKLCVAGLERVRVLGSPFCVVLGHPTYYPRFGFAPAAARGLYFLAGVDLPAFMVLELEPGALGGRAGLVRYAPEFDAPEIAPQGA